MILDQVKEAYVKDLLSKGKRADGRKLDEYRRINVEKALYTNSEGSAIAHLGDTKVLAAVKFDVLTPFADRPNEGVVMCNAEFSPIAHPDFEPGPPDERSIELARVVDRGIRSANVVDAKKLFRSEGKVLGVFIDLYTLDHTGNLTDAAALAAMAALKTAKVPKYEDEKLVRGEYAGKLELNNTVVTTTFEKVGGKLLVDATNEEEVASEGRFTIATAEDNKVAACQKSGKAGFSEQEFMDMIDVALQKHGELVQKI